MPLSWNEIKSRAAAFTMDWKDAVREKAEAKPFLEAFFHVFGTPRRKVGFYEDKVRKLDGHAGYIDLFWLGMLLVEMKSRGEDLSKAYLQAREYAETIPQHKFPRFILISDFNIFQLYDFERDERHEFLLKDLVANIHYFSFIAGY